MKYKKGITNEEIDSNSALFTAYQLYRQNQKTNDIGWWRNENKKSIFITPFPSVSIPDQYCSVAGIGLF